MARFGVLMMVAIQAAVALGTQINLVTTNSGYGGITSSPFATRGRGADFGSAPLFDGKVDTVVTVDTEQPYYSSILVYRYEVKVNRYKIYVGEGTDPSWYPKAWTLTARTLGGDRVLLDTVTGAQFVNGVYAANVVNDGKYELLTLKITRDSTPGDKRLKIKIGEIKYFGPRGQYDRLVDGGYLCRKAPVYVTKADGKTLAQGGVPFSSDSSLSLEALSKLFNDDFFDYQLITLRNRKVIFGYHFPEPLTVVQFGLDWLKDYTPRVPSQGIMKLEGHMCDPTCDYFGRDGWVSLSRGTLEKHYERKLLVQRPGSYRAYRIRYHVHPGFQRFNFGEVHLLKCAEGDEI